MGREIYIALEHRAGLRHQPVVHPPPALVVYQVGAGLPEHHLERVRGSEWRGLAVLAAKTMDCFDEGPSGGMHSVDDSAGCRTPPTAVVSRVLSLRTVPILAPSSLASDRPTEAFVAAVPGRRDPMTVPYPGDLQDLVGQYQDVGRGAARVLDFTVDAGALTLRGGGPGQPLIHLGNGVFGWRSARYAFIRQGGKVTGVRTDHASIHAVLVRQEAPGRCA
jgi:hypothetical protein